MSQRVTFPPADRRVPGFIPHGVKIGELHCEVASAEDLEAIRRTNASCVSWNVSDIVEVTRDGRARRELRLVQASGLVVVFTLAL